jgi:transcriptional regulator with XRE-family HTH domain
VPLDRTRGQRIREERERRKMTQRELAEAIGGYGPNAYRAVLRWEKGQGLDAANARKLADYFGWPAEDLVTPRAEAVALARYEERLTALEGAVERIEQHLSGANETPGSEPRRPHGGRGRGS